MRNRFLIILTYFSLVFVLCGCGNASLETGDFVSDSAFIYSGSFEQHIIDTSIIPVDDFSIVSQAFSDTENYYLFDYYDNLSDQLKYYYFSFDDNGKKSNAYELSLPISVNNGRVVFSSDCEGITTRGSGSAIYENGSVGYDDFTIAEDGSFSAVCRLDLSSFAVSLGRDVFVSDYYMVNWDVTGKCVSVSDYVPDNSYDERTEALLDPYKYFEASDGSIYKKTSSGIVLVDPELNYQSVYFDFINSGVSSNGFEFLNIKGTDSFSCVYLNADGKCVLASFTRKDSLNSGRKPIVLAVSGLSRELRRDIIEYNKSHKDCFISVIDYSVRTVNDDADEGWDLLKLDIRNGFSPDIILNMTGYDRAFENELSTKDALIDLSKAVNSIPDIKDNGFSDKADSLFYSADKVYSVVPYYSFETVVGSIDDYGDKDSFITSDFISGLSSITGSRTIFMSDTGLSFVERTLLFNGSDYVDFDSCSSSFAAKGFSDLLEFAGMLPGDLDEAMNLYYSEENAENVCLVDITCRKLGDMNLYSQRTLKNEYSIVGFPGMSSGRIGVINADCSFMILSGHKYTNECWEFIKRFLDVDYQTSVYMGIPVTATGYSSWYLDRDPSTPDSTQLGYMRDGQYFAVLNLSDDGADYIVDSINKCNYFAFHDYCIEQIVFDYSNQYFEGKISAEEAAHFIDRDVEEYLKG